MGATPVYAFPFPATSDAPNGPLQIEALADSVEDKVVDVEADIADIRGLLQGYTPPTLTAAGTLGPLTAVVAGAIVIPDPGFSYRIEAFGAYGWGMSGATISRLISIHLTVDSATYNVNEMSRGYGKAVPDAVAGATQATLECPRKTSWGFVPFVGSHTVRLIVRNESADANMVLVNTSGEAAFEVKIVPV